MSPPRQRSGPRLDTWGAADVAEVATATDVPTIPRRLPVIRGVLVVDIGAHVEDYGFLGHAAETASAALGCAPAGVAARLDLGEARFVSPRFVEIVAENSAQLRELEVTGVHPETIADLVRQVRARQQACEASW